MAPWWRQRRPSRRELIDRKHRLDGEIRSLAAEVRRRRGRGEDVSGLETRLVGLRRRHYQTRLEIDRTGR